MYLFLKGEQTFIKDGELGDAHNMFIGGVDSLYRIKSYKGEFVDDVREGNGVITYTNGDSIEGYFHHGLAHGTMVYTFAKDASTKVAQYRNGYRIKWVEVKRTSISRSFFSSGLSRKNASNSRSPSPSTHHHHNHNSDNRDNSLSPSRSPSFVAARRRSRRESKSGKSRRNSSRSRSDSED